MPTTYGRNLDSATSARPWVRALRGHAAGDLDAVGQDVGAGHPDAVFALADRRCRTRVPEARDFYRRALAHRAAGRLAAAQRDLAAALALDPSDPALDAAALVWADDETRLSAAARAVDRSGASWAMRRKALAALIEAGSRITHRLRRGPRGVAGWIAWTGGGPLDIEATDDGGTRTLRLDPDPDHPLAQSDLAAAEVAIETHDSGRVALALKTQDGFALRLDPRFEARPRPRAAAAAAPRDAAPPFLTVIVPVYEDFAATRGCLEALAAAPPACGHEIVVVDDASPNAALKDWLDQAAASGRFRLIRNDSNLGFAAAVNRALARRERGDALLLNADALPPPGAIDRLAALSRAAPDIGTLTPFSNNGELLSYPIRNAANPLPSAAEIAALDALARENNAGALVDIPNGVGFCLYVTEPCLDAVGGLPEIYAEGYFEDVDFCLTARERGFRNVAALGVFVGHAGSKSFAARKQALVMRNLLLIEARFPGYRLETAAFVALDPLRAYRAALDLAAPPPGPTVLVACGPNAAAARGRRRAEALTAENPEAKVLTLIADGRGRLSLSAVGGGAPQSLAFDNDAAGAAAFAAYLARLDLRRVEWRDPAALPEAALAALMRLEAEIDHACGELTGFAAPPAPSQGPCLAPAQSQPCEDCRRLAASPPGDAEGPRQRRFRLGRALERAERIVPLDQIAECFAERVFKSRAQRFEGPPLAARPLAEGAAFRLGAFYPQRAPATERLLLRLARRFAGGAGELVVFGAALDESALFATGAAFVTGRVALDELAELSRHLGVDALLAPDRSGGYGEVEAAGAALSARIAYFDWSFGAFRSEDGDLSLDPRICDDKATAEIVAWMNGEPQS